MSRYLIAAGIFGLMSGLPVQAETMKMKANIPFEFHIGRATLPAGTYVVSHSAGVVSFRQEGGEGKAAVALSQSTYANSAPDASKIVFNRYEDEHFLSGVWQTGIRTGIVVPQNKREKELIARSKGLVQTAGVAIRAK